MQPVESPRPEIAICAYPVFEFPLGTCRQCGVSFAAGMRANVNAIKERKNAPKFRASAPEDVPQMVLDASPFGTKLSYGTRRFCGVEDNSIFLAH